MNLLNEGCKFQCFEGNPSILITVSERGNHIARDSKRKILTDKAICEVKTPLICNCLTIMSEGIPTNCHLVQMKWMNTSDKLKCNGNNVLTDKSYMKCIYGGTIRPIETSHISKIGTNVVISDISNNNKKDINHRILNVDIQDKADNDIKVQNIDLDDKQNFVELNTYSAKENTHSIYASYTMCDYENCAERESCKYFNSQVFVENSAAKLSANFQNHRKEEWNKYLLLHKQKNNESKNGGWRIAAHHIISGNQVLMMRDDNGEILYGAIIKLANYFGYDINNEWNCIMLPTNESNFGQMEQVMKIASAYEVMWTMGRQWHVGGHQYSLGKDTLQNMLDFYKKHPEQYYSLGSPNFFVNYKMAVKEEMDKLLMKYSRIQCWKKNYERKCQRFFEDMNGISTKIEKYLLNFGSNPKKSFPFFVSKVAVEYAYDLPARTKIIVIYKKGIELRAKRISVERYRKNEFKIIPIEKADIEIGDRKKFIIFCENAMHFLLDSAVKEYSLPFCKTLDNEPEIRRIDFQGGDIMDYFRNHGTELLAFVNQNKYTYQPIAKMVAMREGI